MLSERESVTCESYTATVGVGIVFIVWTRVQSRPSNSAANSTGESFITPFMIGGQRNDPCCNCFQINTSPLVSHTNIFTRSPRLQRQTITTPENGYVARRISLHMC